MASLGEAQSLNTDETLTAYDTPIISKHRPSRLRHKRIDPDTTLTRIHDEKINKRSTAQSTYYHLRGYYVEGDKSK